MIHDDDHNKLNEFLAEVNKRLGSKLEMDLPRIVVIGVQSAGKSSVLNRVIGFIIFPQASGTTTTCPIILRVFKIPESEEEGIELDNFPDAGRISDNDEVMAKIANLMEKNGGKLVDTPIGVRVYSRTLLPFTVIDMPGITKLAEGLSEDDLIKLSLKYITEKNTKILAVTPANDDISNSVAIQLAQKVDPEGKRTLVVLTKIDMMEKGTNALDLLSGKLPSLKQKLEIVGLVNRSQADIKKGVTLALQLQNEQEYLKEHYTDLAEQNGIGYLQKRLNKLLMPHLVNWLPDQLIQWKEKLQLCIDRLAKHPQELPLNQELDFLYKIVRRFEDGMKTEIQGCTQHPELHYLYGGVRIKYVYQKRFYEGIVAAEKAAQNSITKEMISNAFMNTESYNSIRSYAEPVFRTLAKEEIIRLVEPALKCADEVFDEIVKIADRNLKEKEDKDLRHFPAVQDVLRQGVIEEATAKLATLKEDVKDYIRVQSHDTFTMDLNLLNTIESFMHKLDLLMHASSQMSAKKKGKKSRKGIVEGAKGIVEGATEKVLGEKVAKVVKTAGDVLSWTAVVKGANLVEAAITDAVMENGNETKVVKPASASSTNRRDLFREILKTDEFIELVKEMVRHYYIAIRSDIQCYIPKLISNRLLMPFVDKEGNFGLALNALIKAKHESGSLTRLSPKLQKERDDDLQLKKDLEELIKKGTEIRNDYKPDEGVEDMSSHHQQKEEEGDNEDDDDQDSAQSGEETDDDDPW